MADEITNATNTAATESAAATADPTGTVMTGTAESSAAGTGEPQDGATGTETGKTAEPELKIGTEKKENASRLIGVIKGLQDEIKALKGDKTTDTKGARAEKTADASDTDPLEHPAVKGLKVTDDGDVMYHGVAVPPEFVIQMEARAEKTADLEAKLAELESGRTTDKVSEAEAKLARVQEEFVRGIADTVSEVREQAFPNLPKDAQAPVDDYLCQITDTLLSQRVAQGQELTGDAAVAAVETAISQARELFGIFGTLQFQSNREHADQNKLRPDGQMGVPAPVATKNLSRSERAKVIAERVRIAEAQSQQ